jgi:hypothetical protein
MNYMWNKRFKDCEAMLEESDFVESKHDNQGLEQEKQLTEVFRELNSKNILNHLKILIYHSH